MKILISIVILSITLSSFCQIDDLEKKIKELEERIKEQEKILLEQQKTIELLREELEKQKKSQDQWTQKREEKGTELKKASLFGASALFNPNISVIFDFSYKNIDLFEKEESFSIFSKMKRLEHEEEDSSFKRGFKFNYAELYIYAPVDPFFNFYLTMPFSEEGSEVEEAYFVTTSLPKGFQIKGGKFKSSFGRLNSIHPHMWNFYDAPLPYNYFLGEEGITDKGLSFNYLFNTPFYLIAGLEILQGENKNLFLNRSNDGPNDYTFYMKSSFDVGRFSSFLTGVSFMRGDLKQNENQSINGKLRLFDFEFTYKWKKSKYKGFVFQGEYLKRIYDFNQISISCLPQLKIDEYGYYFEGIYIFQEGKWRAGMRYDRLNLFKGAPFVLEESEMVSDDPSKYSFMIEFNPSEFARIRFQYNYNRNLNRKKNEFILQFTFGIGAHAAHSY